MTTKTLVTWTATSIHKPTPEPQVLAVYSSVKEAYNDTNRLARLVLDPLSDDERTALRRGRLEISQDGVVLMAVPMRDAELYQPLLKGGF